MLGASGVESKAGRAECTRCMFDVPLSHRVWSVRGADLPPNRVELVELVAHPLWAAL